MKLQAKGENEYVTFRYEVPKFAQAGSHTVLSAYIGALESMLVSINSENQSDTVAETRMENFVAMKKLRDFIYEDMARGDLILQMIETKLMTVDDG